MASHEHLIIGAGPVGLAMAKALGEAHIPYVQVEATDHVGGNWAHGVYDMAHIISSRKTTEYADWPMPESYPDFPSAVQMKDYFEAYADTFDLRQHIRFETRAAQVDQRQDGLWEATLSGTTEVFKGVVVCNGHHWSRRLPAWVDSYAGSWMHSKDYKRADALAGKRILVIGGGNSACDIVSEAARVGASADWSLRRGYWFLPKTFLGVPTVELMVPWMPITVQRAVMKTLLYAAVGPYDAYGLPEPDHDLFEAHPSVSTEALHYLKHGRIQVRPDVARTDDQVHFTDGTTGTYDLVIAATGFDVAFPFLPPGMVEVHGKIAQVYGGSLVLDRRHLYVVGTTQPRYGLGPLVRPAAVLLAEWIQLQDQIETPLANVLHSLGGRPPDTHLVDPHQALRRLRLARHLGPLIRWRGRSLDQKSATAVPPSRTAMASGLSPDAPGP
jgi:hypothetical protein